MSPLSPRNASKHSFPISICIADRSPPEPVEQFHGEVGGAICFSTKQRGNLAMFARNAPPFKPTPVANLFYRIAGNNDHRSNGMWRIWRSPENREDAL